MNLLGLRCILAFRMYACVVVCVCVCSHPLPDALVLGQGHDGLDVLVCELADGDALVLAGDVIGHDDRGEDGEAVGHVQGAVVVVVVDSRQLLLSDQDMQRGHKQSHPR